MTSRETVLLIVAGALLHLCSGVCPPGEYIFPCTCDKGVLTCRDITDQALRRISEFKKSLPEGKGELNVVLRNYSSPYIPAGIFQGLNVKSLEITTSVLLSFHDGFGNKSSFLGVEDTLLSLTLTYVDRPMSDFDWASLGVLRNLRNLFLYGTFTAIQTPLPPLPTVAIFWLQDSQVKYIADKAFTGLTGVQELRVSDNQVDKYGRNMFARPLKNLTLFITRSEKFLTLPEDYFDEMPALSYVHIPDFAHNIPPLMVDGPTNLQGSRGLTCDCRLKWLLRMRDEGKVNILHAICARPQHLYWRNVKDLSVDDL